MALDPRVTEESTVLELTNLCNTVLKETKGTNLIFHMKYHQVQGCGTK